jgi:hypothetical protein
MSSGSWRDSPGQRQRGRGVYVMATRPVSAQGAIFLVEPSDARVEPGSVRDCRGADRLDPAGHDRDVGRDARQQLGETLAHRSDRLVGRQIVESDRVLHARGKSALKMTG